MHNRETQRITEKIEEIFDAASELPAEKRPAFLDANLDPLDESDRAVRLEVERLLSHHDSSGVLDQALIRPSPDSPAEAPALEPGEVVAGRFRINKMIGFGGMGEVYEADDLAVGETVALKTVRAEIAADAALTERFRRELRISRTLAHRNVCKVFDYEDIDRGTRGRLRFFTMELLHGETLARRLESVGRLSPTAALAILRQVAAGIDEVHRSGIIHRDLKPSNIFLAKEADGSERPVVMDFGIARDLSADDLRQTRTGMVMGTRLYMAPELRSAIGTFSDVYSFGVIALEMVTGSSSPIVAPRSVVPSLDPAWDKALLVCLNLDPAKRPRTTLEVVSMLERRTGGGRRAAIAAGVVAICSAAGAGLWYQLHPGPLHAPDPTPITSDPGTTREPASSADGKLLAYSSDRNNPAGDLNIWLQNMETGKTRQITTDPGNEDEPALSPDGKLIAWRSSRGDTVFLRPVAGGAPRELARQAHIPRFSPDGRYIAWWQGAEDDPNIRATIWVTPLDAGPGEEPRQLATDFADARLPSWTPDGRYILFRGSRAASASKGPIDDWWLASLDGSPPRPTGIGPRLRSAGLEAHESPVLWDGSQIMFAARLQSESVNLWSVRFLRLLGRSFVLGAPTTVTTSPNLQDTPAFLTGRRVAYTEWREQINLFRIDLSSGDLKPITGQQTFDTKVSVSADGQTLVFGRFHGTYRDVWLKDRRAPEGENERQLSDRKEMAVPFVSPDGRTAAVSSGTAIRLIDIATTSEAPVCSDCGELRGWMPRTQQLLYWENTPPAPSVRLLDLATRTKTTLLSAPSLNDSVVSPDGNTLAFTIRADGAHSVIYISRLDQSGAGGPWTRITPEEGWADKPLWSPDGKTLYFSSNLDGFLCIWKRQVDPARLRANGEIQEVRHFHKASQSLWQLSPSGFALALGGGGLFLSVDIAQTNIVAVRR